jgi:single-stranded-DNA-specific exonuclease
MEQARIFEQASDIAAQMDLDQKKVLVLASPGWNSGVVGIVASKIVERFGRPAILLSVDENLSLCSGSARSIEAFDITEALRQCCDVLDRCGGHAFAAGLSLKMDKLSDFDAKINSIAQDLIKPEDMIPRVVVDAQVDPGELTRDMVSELAMLEPFGHGNPDPLFIS